VEVEDGVGVGLVFCVGRVWKEGCHGAGSACVEGCGSRVASEGSRNAFTSVVVADCELAVDGLAAVGFLSGLVICSRGGINVCIARLVLVQTSRCLM